MDDIDELMAGLDRPVALPPAVRARLAGAVSAATGGDDPLAGADRARPLPAATRDRLTAALEASVVDRRRAGARIRPTGTRWLAVAAAVVLLAGAAGIVSLASKGRRQRGTEVASAPSRGSGALSTGSGAAAGGVAAPGGSAAAAGPAGTLGASDATSGGMAGAGAAGSAAGAGPAAAGPPPPFAFATPAGPASAAPAAPTARAAPWANPLVVRVAGGDASERRGFDAYLSLLNAGGGINGHPLEAGAAGAVATVNLSDAPLATPPAGPALETLAVPERILRVPVYDLASAPVHQAALAVAVMFPKPAPGAVAVVVRGSGGIWGGDVADAYVAALRQRLVTPLVVPYTPGRAFSAPPAAAAFLSLDTAGARSWLSAGYRPSGGIAGIFSLAEPSLLPLLPAGTVAVAPYALPGGAEQAALAQAIGGPPGMAAIHGWVSAKVLAVALWRSGATTPSGVAAALGALGGYRDGWAPPLAYRPGTTSRTPDGTVLRVAAGAFTGDGSFAVGS